MDEQMQVDEEKEFDQTQEENNDKNEEDTSYSEEEIEEDGMGNKVKKELIDLLKTFIVCFVAVFIITNFFIKPVQVDGDSMYPTLIDKELGGVNILFAKIGGVSRGDVVVVHNPDRDQNWVKRVIALPNETIYARDDVVYVNDKPIEEPYLDTDYVKGIRSQGNYFTEDFGPVTLKDDEYFLMGDNRVVSLDSRRVGPFHREDIMGKDVYVIFPFNEIRFVRNN